MIEAIQKRPFIRPLFLWITGIMVAVYVPVSLYWIPVLLLFPAGFILGVSWFAPASRSVYEGRFAWGIVFSLLLLSLAVLYTAYRLSLPVSPSFYGEQWASSVQAGLVSAFSCLGVGEKEEAVLATLVLGDRSRMSWELTHSFTAAGVVHILSVSGFHVAVLYRFLSFFFSLAGKGLLVRWLDFLVLLLCVWGFTVISGLDSPTVRSALMISLYSFGKTFRLQGDAYNTWASAAFLMLVYNPFYLFDIGFQLSFLAVFSIQYYYSKLLNRLDLRNPLLRAVWSGLVLTVSAQIATLPLCLYYFREVSWVFLFTSLPVSWLSSLLIPLGLCWLLLDVLRLSFVWLDMSLAACVESLVALVELFADVPAFSMTLESGGMLALYATIVSASVYGYRHSFGRAMLFLGCTLLFLLCLLFRA